MLYDGVLLSSTAKPLTEMDFLGDLFVQENTASPFAA